MNILSLATPTGTIRIGQGEPLTLIAGPCVIESEQLVMDTARILQDICGRLGIDLVFKASFDKANRTSLTSFRGPGLDKGLEILSKVKESGLPVISDIHLPDQAAVAAEVLDILQIPAFLCRQTDLLVAAAVTGRPISLKKGQFVSPWDMEYAVRKIRESGNDQILLTERGASFGYNNLVVDMRSISIMQSFGCPVVYDATHSVQLPGGAGGSSSGQRQFIAPLARAAIAAGANALFMEVHPNPEEALCDGPNSFPLDQVEPLLRNLLAIHAIARQNPVREP